MRLRPRTFLRYIYWEYYGLYEALGNEAATSKAFGISTIILGIAFTAIDIKSAISRFYLKSSTTVRRDLSVYTISIIVVTALFMIILKIVGDEPKPSEFETIRPSFKKIFSSLIWGYLVACLLIFFLL